MENQDIYSYITQEINNFKTVRVPLTGSKDWNMKEHVERCTNVANGWFHSGKNDGLRPYDDVVTPVINVGFRSEGFDVKDIVPYVDSITEDYKSFLVKKFHPQWARKNELDTLIDDIVESSIIYDLVLCKNVNEKKPEIVDLKTIAFCDQTEVMAGPICIEHQYTIEDLISFKGKWNDDKIEEAILLSEAEKSNSIADDQTVKTPSKYIKAYELRGKLPKKWIDDGATRFEYENQMHVVCFYTDKEGKKNGITLYKGLDKPLADNFKSLKIDRIRSKGRACGKSIVETLFEPQVWRNYDAIKIKELLDGALSILQTDSEEYKNQKLSNLKTNTILGHETGKPITRVDGSIQNLTAFTNDQIKQENQARILGSASDAQLGTNPASGTPFALQQLVVQQGQGLHEYRQGKIATFFADVLYRDWILGYLVDEMNQGVKFSEILSLDEIQEIAPKIAKNYVQQSIKQMILETGRVPTIEERDQMEKIKIQELTSKGQRYFFEIIKGELQDVPLKVFVNIKGKQRYMAQNADKITNILREVMRNPQAFSQMPGVSKAFNQVLEESGLSPIDFTQITTAQPQPSVQTNELPPVEGEKLLNNKQ